MSPKSDGQEVNAAPFISADSVSKCLNSVLCTDRYVFFRVLKVGSQGSNFYKTCRKKPKLFNKLRLKTGGAETFNTRVYSNHFVTRGSQTFWVWGTPYKGKKFPRIPSYLKIKIHSNIIFCLV